MRTYFARTKIISSIIELWHVKSPKTTFSSSKDEKKWENWRLTTCIRTIRELGHRKKPPFQNPKKTNIEDLCWG